MDIILFLLVIVTGMVFLLVPILRLPCVIGALVLVSKIERRMSR